MVTPLDVAIELSDLFEATGYEGTELAALFDNEILPMLKTPLHETDVVGMGERFSKAIDRIRASLSQMKGDRIRTLMDMMKSSILTYIQRTHDVRTGREVFNRAVRSGGDTMLTVTGAAMLSNALASNHAEQAMTLLKGVAAKLSGAQPKPVTENADMMLEPICVDIELFIRMLEFAREDAKDDLILHKVIERAEELGHRGKKILDMSDYTFLTQDQSHSQVSENASGAAVSSGVIATFATGNKKRKPVIRRRDSLFAEDLSWNDLEGQPDTIQKMNEISDTMENMIIEGVIVDPSTAELVLAVHDSLSGQKQHRYASKPVSEMIEIAHRVVQRGIISVVME